MSTLGRSHRRSCNAFVTPLVPLPSSLDPTRRPRTNELTTLFRPLWKACAEPGTSQSRHRKIPKIYSTFRDNPMRTRAGQMRQVIRAQRHRKKGNWRLASSTLLSIEQHAGGLTEFLTEMVHVRAAQALENFTNLTPKELSDLLFDVIDQSNARPVQATMNAVLCGLQKRLSGPQHGPNDTLDVCVRILDAMVQRGIAPDDFTFSLVYRMSALAESQAYLDLFQRRAIETTGSLGGSIACTSLVCARSKLGDIDGADFIVKDMRRRSLHLGERAYACIIGSCHRAGRHARVVQLFKEAMSAEDIQVSAYLFSGVVASCCKVGDAPHARLAVETMMERKVMPNVEILDGVFNTAVRCSDVALASDILFDWAHANDAFVCRREHCVKLIASAGRNRHEAHSGDMVRLAWDVVARMDNGLGPVVDVSTLNALTSTLVKLGRGDEAREVVEREMPRRGLVPNVGSFNALINAVVLSGDTADALAVVDEMREKEVQPDQVTYNLLLEMARACDDHDARRAVLKEIERNPVLKIDMVATTVLLQGMRDRREAEGVLRLHREVIAGGGMWDAKAYGLVLTILFECGQIDDAIGLFAWLMWRGMAVGNIYNVMIHQMGRRKDGFADCARLFTRLKESGEVADEFTYTSMIRACSKHGRMDRAFRLLGEMQDVGVGMSDRFAWTAVIDGCGRGGMWERGIELLQMMRQSDGRSCVVPRPTTACYNAGLYAAGIHGSSWSVALEIFRALVADVDAEPDAVTYSAMASIILRHRFDIREMGVVDMVLKALVRIVEAETKRGVAETKRGVAGGVKGEGRARGGVRRLVFRRKLDKVELKKLQAKVKRLGWIAQFNDEVAR